MREHNFYVYIVRCADGAYYTGITNNTQRRIAEHNDGLDPKSYTFRRRPVVLQYAAHFENVWDAIHWEKIVKRWSRAKKEALIAGDWGKLPELSLGTVARFVRSLVAMVRRTHHDNFARSSRACHPESVEGRHASSRPG